MITYLDHKAKARQAAIDWQLSLKGGESYGEMAEAQNHFAKLAKRYGLVGEFRENGII